MSSTNHVSLRPWPAPSKDDFDPDELGRQLNQLSTQKSNFRYVTEDALRADISSTVEVANDVAGEGKPTAQVAIETDKDRLRKIYEVKEKMSVQLQYVPFPHASSACANLIRQCSILLRCKRT